MTPTARSGPPKDRPAAPAPPPPPGWRRWLIPIGLALTAVLLLFPRMGAAPTTRQGAPRGRAWRSSGTREHRDREHPSRRLGRRFRGWTSERY